MPRVMDVVYLLHFVSIAVVLVGAFRLGREVRGVRGFDVNPNLAKRVLSRTRAVSLGMWGIVATGLALAVGGLEIGFVAARVPVARALPPGVLLAYIVLLVVVIAGAFHPMVAITYRLVPALMERPGNLTPEEAERLIARLRRNATLLTVIVLAVLAAGALRWLYAAALF